MPEDDAPTPVLPSNRLAREKMKEFSGTGTIGMDPLPELRKVWASKTSSELYEDVLQGLRAIPNTTWRTGAVKILRSPEASYCLVMQLGLTCKGHQEPMLAVKTWTHAWLTSLILAYLNSLAAEAGFQTPLSGTSLRVTKNHEAHWHQHDDNTGLQYMTTLGDFAGGETFIVEEEGQEVMELKQAVEGLGLAGQKIRGQRKDARRRIITFHGRKLHCTCPFLDTDERYAITLFSCSNKGLERTSTLTLALLNELGFVSSEPAGQRPALRPQLQKAVAKAASGFKVNGGENYRAREC
ncbi:unnamed protein product [Symbiodinium natans]|uniref:Uncharacterized protein n=1 Tax=Symbiodinium natans TaxID=878477 RepID=A0A812V1N3_9DINO|nr:unnamed protein product [Symbiodinium natans]